MSDTQNEADIKILYETTNNIIENQAELGNKMNGLVELMRCTIVNASTVIDKVAKRWSLLGNVIMFSAISVLVIVSTFFYIMLN